MKKIKFLPILMAMFLGLSFGLISCGDDDDNNGNTENNTYVEKDVIAKGRTFYSNLEKTTSGDASVVAAATAAIVLDAAEYTKNKNNKEWTTNFLAGVVMEKYKVDDANIAKSEQYMNKVADLKNVLDNGITADNVANALVTLAGFISKN